MLTPVFAVTQDDDFIYIAVEVSNVRFSAKAIEMVASADLFVFSLPPYYLRLRLPHNVVDDERSHAAFNSASGCVDIKIPKEIPGQNFPDLDLPAKLLARKEVQPKGPLIEELDVTNEVSDERNLAADAAAHDWEIEQHVAPAPLAGAQYGFNHAFSGLVGVSTANGNDINELGDPESAAPVDRVLERLIKENIKFDPEYYAADYILEKHPADDDDKDFAAIFAWKLPLTTQFLAWYKQQQLLLPENRDSYMPVEFTKEEHERMVQLPRKSHLVDPAHVSELLALIVSLLFAYHYDLRENEGEHTVESAWTVGKLVPQIAFLDAQLHIASSESTSILRAAVVSGFRRALSYPYHRSYNLAVKAWSDAYYTLRGGRRMVVRALLAARELFRFHPVYYVYDKVWLEDLCVWAISDSVSELLVRQLAHDLKRETEKISRQDITFEKVDDTQTGDAMVVLDVGDVEAMAEESYAQMG